jgi:hypothetical protein
MNCDQIPIGNGYSQPSQTRPLVLIRGFRPIDKHLQSIVRQLENDIFRDRNVHAAAGVWPPSDEIDESLPNESLAELSHLFPSRLTCIPSKEQSKVLAR